METKQQQGDKQSKLAYMGYDRNTISKQISLVHVMSR